MITLSVSTWLVNDRMVRDPAYSIKNALDDLKAAGFLYVDANLWNLSKRGMPLSQDNWKEWVQEMRAYADAIGLAFRQTHGQTLSDLQWDDMNYPDREFVFAMNYRCIEASKILGAEWMVMHPYNLPHDPLYNRKKGLEANVAYLAPYVEYAKKMGVGIAVENMVDYGHRRRRYCAGDPEELIELVDHIHDPAVGMCIDTGHANNSGVHVPSFIRMAGDRLKCTHVNDNLGDKDSHLPPYFGSIDWKDTVQALRDIHYEGDFSFELNPQSYPTELHPNWHRFLCQLGNDLLKL